MGNPLQVLFVDNGLRSFSASTFTRPMVFVVAISCRLMFVMQTRSESTIVRWRMPERTRLSAHQLPTPPTPNIITFVSAVFCMTCSPTSNSIRLNIPFSIPMDLFVFLLLRSFLFSFCCYYSFHLCHIRNFT